MHVNFFFSFLNLKIAISLEPLKPKRSNFFWEITRGLRFEKIYFGLISTKNKKVCVGGMKITVWSIEG